MLEAFLPRTRQCVLLVFVVLLITMATRQRHAPDAWQVGTSLIKCERIVLHASQVQLLTLLAVQMLQPVSLARRDSTVACRQLLVQYARQDG